MPNDDGSKASRFHFSLVERLKDYGEHMNVSIHYDNMSWSFTAYRTLYKAKSIGGIRGFYSKLVLYNIQINN